MAEKVSFSQYDEKIDAASKKATRELEEILRSRGAFPNVEKYREYLKQEIPNLVAKYEKSAASTAAECYNDWRKQVLGKDIKEQTLNPNEGTYRERSESSVRSLSHLLKEAEQGNMSWEDADEKTIARFSKMVDRRIRAFAKDTMMYNSKLDEKGTGCASVPRGSKPCAFCLEMAKVGVAYSFQVMKIKNKTFHDRCRCVFVPGFAGHDITIDVDGREYSSDHIRNAMDSIRQTLGIKQNAEPTQEVVNAERQELARRDYDWVKWGEDAGVEYEKKRKKLSERERKTADVLSSKGISHKWVKENNGGIANIDLNINGQKWEEKSPLGASRSAVFENLADAVSKWDRLNLKTERRIVYSNAYGKREDSIVSKEIKSMMSELNIKEVLFIGKDGSLLRLKKQ